MTAAVLAYANDPALIIIIPGLIGLSATWLWEHRRYRDRITQQRITQQRRADALAALGRINRKVSQP